MAKDTKVLALGLLLVGVIPLIFHIDGIEAATGDGTVDDNLGEHASGATDPNTVEREEQAMSADGFSVHERKMMEAAAEQFTFQAEVSRLMGLIINSLYSNKEIFLRELISNASDALDKIRYASLTDSEALAAKAELEIRIEADEEFGVIHITDSGVGMTRQDLIDHLGSIASSGTQKFVEALSDGSADSNLIGQFGVGFYSAFLVADEVTVTTKNNDDDQYIWKSTADADYTIVKDPRGNTLGRGTRITLTLKEDALEFMDQETLRDLVQRYSEFITFPIYLWAMHEEEEQVLVEKEADEAADDDEVDADDEASDDDEEVEDVEDEEDEPEYETVVHEVWDWELINTVQPIWTRSKDDIDDDEYAKFYQTLSGSSGDPQARIHFAAEGELDFKSILFIPDKAPSNMFQNYGQKLKNISLYVRRVFITDDFEDILPKYLSFIVGMVDSDNLPLNVSREMLQQHKMLKTIKKKLTRKCLEMIKNIGRVRGISEDDEGYEEAVAAAKEDYMTFWSEFGTNIKLGLIEDTANRTKLAKLLRFHSSKAGGPEEMTSLAEYVERMHEGQDHIYYLAGDSVEEVESSPYLEVLLKRGYEVLYLVDPVDEYAASSLPEFDGKKLQNAAKEGLDLGEGLTDKDDDEALEAEFADLTLWLKLKLADKIEKVVLSRRLYDSPAALISGHFGYSPAMKKVMTSQALASNDASANFFLNAKLNLHINPRHPLIKELNARAGEDEDDAVAAEMAQLLYDSAALGTGYEVDSPKDFAQRVYKFMMLGLDIDPDTPVEEPDFSTPVEDDDDADADDVDPEEEEEIDAEDDAASDAHDEL